MLKRTFYFAAPGLFILLSFLDFRSFGQSNKLSPKEISHGWTSLFDGKDLKGWHSYLKSLPGKGWSVEKGAINLNPSVGDGGDLVSDKVYKNFELALEWNISSGGNSGVMFDVQEDPKYSYTFLTGPEMQVLDNLHAEDNKLASHLAGSLYDLIPANPKFVKPAGQWNSVMIRVKDKHVTLWMNGHKVVETQIGDDAWKNLVANSKFKKWKGFAASSVGHIALQDHGDRVSFRNIRLRKL